jgi:Zn-dependent protease
MAAATGVESESDASGGAPEQSGNEGNTDAFDKAPDAGATADADMDLGVDQEHDPAAGFELGFGGDAADEPPVRRKAAKPKRDREPRLAPQSKGLVVGRLAGAPIVITPSWLLAAVVLTSVFALYVRPRVNAPLWGVTAIGFGFTVLLFISVFCHEAAHAVMAKRRGHAVRELAVTLWGGHTEYTGRAAAPGDIILVSAVGPLVSLVIAGLFAAGLALVPDGSVASLLFGAALYSNVFVGVFNLLPGLPLDGGQILEAAVWKATGWRARGTQVAGWTGRILAIIVVAASIAWAVVHRGTLNYTVVLWGAFVALFLWTGAGAAINSGRLRQTVGTISARTLATRAVVVPSGMSMSDAATASAGVPAAVVVIDDAGRPLGWVDGEAAASIDTRDMRKTAVDAAIVAFPAGSEVDVALAGTALLDHLVATAGESTIVPVLDAGRVVGVLDVATVAEELRKRTK